MNRQFQCLFTHLLKKDSTNSFTGKKEVDMTDEETRLIKVDSTEVEPCNSTCIINSYVINKINNCKT